jgi:TPR repeat protein
MALRAHEIQALSGSAPAHLRGLYHAAIAQLAYHSLIPGSGGDLRLALGRSKTASSDGFTPAMNLYAHIACLEDDSGILGFLKPDKGDCFETTLRAAEAKDILAMGNLSYLYREGVGTARNPMMAASWAHLAANRAPPLPRAQNDMGYYYETGVPVSRDLTEAKRYYGLARGSYPLAQANLDRLSGKGGGGPLVAATVDF